MNPGRFITFEGGEGAGKSTQIRLLKTALDAHLSAQNIEIVLTREPGGTTGGEDIRNLLVNGEAQKWEPLSEALLNYAARHEHIEKVIRPALARGAWVICDRFADSTMAYQGYGHGMDREIIRRLHRLVVGDFQPDLTFVLDVPVKEGLNRASIRGTGEDRYERMDVAFHDRLHQGFMEIAKKSGRRCVVIDALGDIGAVAMAIRSEVSERFHVDI